MYESFSKVEYSDISGLINITIWLTLLVMDHSSSQGIRSNWLICFFFFNFVSWVYFQMKFLNTQNYGFWLN